MQQLFQLPLYIFHILNISSQISLLVKKCPITCKHFKFPRNPFVTVQAQDIFLLDNRLFILPNVFATCAFIILISHISFTSFPPHLVITPSKSNMKKCAALALTPSFSIKPLANLWMSFLCSSTSGSQGDLCI